MSKRTIWEEVVASNNPPGSGGRFNEPPAHFTLTPEQRFMIAERREQSRLKDLESKNTPKKNTIQTQPRNNKMRRR